MKKVIYTLIVLLLVVSGLVVAHHENKNDTTNKPTPKPLSAGEMATILKKWEVTPEGLNFRKWEASPEGVRVLAAAAKIKNQISDSTMMDAVVTSLSLPPGSRLGFGVMVKIQDEDYILSLGSLSSTEFQHVHNLKVNDKIKIRSHFVSYAPKYAYAILSAYEIDHGGKMVYKRAPKQGGC